jgi:2-hydroxychromene-2-carboxylate isomerase
MAPTEVILYTDYKSPYAYLANEGAYALEDDFDVRLVWRPYTLNISSYLGDVESRDDHQWRRVRYSYMDCRRTANERGLIVYGPKKIFDSSIAHIGMLFAQGAGVFRAYNDTVFERFWRRELEIEDPQVISSVLAEVGADPKGFSDFLAGEGREEHDRLRAEAEEMGVFGVPMFVIEGELFWGGDRLPILRRRLAALGS